MHKKQIKDEFADIYKKSVLQKLRNLKQINPSNQTKKKFLKSIGKRFVFLKSKDTPKNTKMEPLYKMLEDSMELYEALKLIYLKNTFIYLMMILYNRYLFGLILSFMILQLILSTYFCSVKAGKSYFFSIYIQQSFLVIYFASIAFHSVRVRETNLYIYMETIFWLGFSLSLFLFVYESIANYKDSVKFILKISMIKR